MWKKCSLIDHNLHISPKISTLKYRKIKSIKNIEIVN
jgi:hypothetical protein